MAASSGAGAERFNSHRVSLCAFCNKAIHSLVRLFAQDLAIKRYLMDAAAERHALFFIELVKLSDIADLANASVVSEELDDTLVAAEWSQQRMADYEFVICLESFLQQSSHWQQAIVLMSGFLSLAESIEDWHAVAQLRIQQAKYLTLRGEWTQAESILAPSLKL